MKKTPNSKSLLLALLLLAASSPVGGATYTGRFQSPVGTEADLAAATTIGRRVPS